MAEPSELNPSPPEPPTGQLPPSTLVKHRRPWSVSLIWLVPAIAVLLGLSVAVRAWTSSGPSIQIRFNTAEGLEAGKTQVKFKNVVIGSVGGIRLSPDRKQVIADVKLNKSASAFATVGSRFWVVRPRVGAGGISGIDTLLSGAFIGADAGTSEDEERSFVGLDEPPAVTQGEAGRQFLLRADDLGSLDIGSPVYYRRIQVGRVVAIKLNDAGGEIGVGVFVAAPHDKLVTRTTRFWNASGLDVSIGAGGLKVNTQSLATVINGGIAFQAPPRDADPKPAPENTIFKLAADQKAALAQPDGEGISMAMRFRQPLRGLTVGAPVDFQGVEVGNVATIDLDYDPAAHTFSTVVETVLYPERLGRAYRKILPEIQTSSETARAEIMTDLVNRGLRAQARAGNLLTGQLYIAINFVPNAPKVAFNAQRDPVELPTVGGQYDQLQEQISSIAAKIEKVPFDSIGQRLDTTLGSLDKTLKRVNGDVLPAVSDTLHGATKALNSVDKTLGSADKTLGSVDDLVGDDSALRRDLTQTLQELQRSALSLRAFTDYLGRHPESLIRGRSAPDALLPQAPLPPAPLPSNNQGKP